MIDDLNIIVQRDPSNALGVAGDEWKHQEAHDFHHQVFTKPDNKSHQQQQEQRHKTTVQSR